jgi:hypothetical protein
MNSSIDPNQNDAKPGLTTRIQNMGTGIIDGAKKKGTDIINSGSNAIQYIKNKGSDAYQSITNVPNGSNKLVGVAETVTLGGIITGVALMIPLIMGGSKKKTSRKYCKQNKKYFQKISRKVFVKLNKSNK